MDSFFQSPAPVLTGFPGENSPEVTELSPEDMHRALKTLSGEILRKSFPDRTIRVFSPPEDGLFLGFFRSRDSGRDPELSPAPVSPGLYFAEAPFSCPADIALFKPDILLEISGNPAVSAKLRFSPECPQFLREAFRKALREEPECPDSDYELRPEKLVLSPDFPAFRDIIFRTRKEMQKTGLRKIVISRKAALEPVEPADPSCIFRTLLRKRLRNISDSGKSYFYAVLSGRDSTLFFSLTPETLIKSAGQKIRTEALAGSCPPGRGQDLLRDGKNLLENSIVVREIETALRDCTTALHTGPLTLKQLSYIEHLKTPLSGILKKGISPLEVSRRLHPTPAVLGFPRKEALHFLEREHLLPDSLYAGLGGILRTKGPGNSSETLNLAVLLRSALAEPRRITLFGGAGILPESHPESEWRETGIKMQAAAGAIGLPEDLLELIAASP